MQGGFGAFGAFVADVAAGAVDGLFHCLTGEYAEQHGNVRVEAELRDRGAHGAVDVLVVRGFAADHGAETDDGGVAARGGQALGDERNLQRAGHPGDVDRVVGDAVLVQRGDGAVEQLAGDRFVPAGDDDGEAVGGVERREGMMVGMKGRCKI